MNFNQIQKKLAVYENGKVIDIKGEIKIEPCQGQLRNPHKKVYRDLKKQEKKLRRKRHGKGFEQSNINRSVDQRSSN